MREPLQIRRNYIESLSPVTAVLTVDEACARRQDGNNDERIRIIVCNVVTPFLV